MYLQSELKDFGKKKNNFTNVDLLEFGSRT